IDEERHNVREAEARIAAERTQWKTDRQHWHDTLQKRVVELEQDRLSLASELEAERRRASDLSQAAADQQRQFVSERAESAAEIRELRGRLAAGGATPDRDANAQHISNGEDEAANAPEPSGKVLREAPIDIIHAEELILKGAMDARPPSTPRTRRPDAAPQGPRTNAPGTNPLHADPVMGPLLSQFQKLQKDVARRREKKK
ncbi:MAG TPA: hypothetical protein VKB78_10530, partial [Pirellulales bacterium]|nr:hypothetical protein [Pirellulales bacterium]